MTGYMKSSRPVPIRGSGSALGSLVLGLAGLALAVAMNAGIAIAIRSAASRYPVDTASIIEASVCAALTAICGLVWWRSERFATLASWLCLTLAIHAGWIVWMMVRGLSLG